MNGGRTARALMAVFRERKRQDEKWGPQSHPDGTGPDVLFIIEGRGSELAYEARRKCELRFEKGQGSWSDILLEEVAEAFAEDDLKKLQTELTHVAAVAVGWIEDIERRTTCWCRGHAWHPDCPVHLPTKMMHPFS